MAYPCGDILKNTLLSFLHLRWNACGSTQEEVINQTSQHTLCFKFSAEEEWKSGTTNKAKLKDLLNKGDLACQSSIYTMVDYNERSCTRGWKGPEGVDCWAQSLCCNRSGSRHYPLTSHHLSPRISPQEMDCRGICRQKTQALLHSGTHI